MYDLWRMDALNELQAYNARKQALENIPARIAELEEALIRIRSSAADGSPVKGGGSGREDSLLNNIVARDKLERNLADTKAAVKRVEGALSTLTDMQRRILQVRYIDQEPCAVEKLSREFNMDPRTVRNRQSDALWLFATAMNGIQKQ